MHFALLFAAKYLFLLIPLIAGIYWLTLPKKLKLEVAVFGVLAAVVAFVLAKTGSAFYYDPRPFVRDAALVPVYPHDSGNGFPSDHTLLSAAIAVTIIYFNARLGVALLVLAAIVGTARVVGHIHSPIDILGSIIFALLGGIVAWWLTPRIMRLFTRKPTVQKQQ